MASFSRSALETLRAAEDALAQRRAHPSAALAGGSDAYALHSAGVRGGGCGVGHWYRDPVNEAPTPTAAVEELQQQLSRAMRELIELRGELAAERDRRHETLAALGRQWKEDVLVEVHRRDAARQSDVAAVEERMAAQWREGSEGRLVVRRQLEEAVRASKVRDADCFQLREELHETARQLEERVDVALGHSSASRAECSRQLEQERATLSQRLDVEMLRLVEMRRDDQRALQQAKELMREESLRARGDVRRAVQETWDSSATALVTAATEPLEQLRAELRQAKAVAQAMDERVTDCVRTCQAECRLLTTTTAERLHALESKEAAAASATDRAERIADAAHEAARHAETTVATVKEAAERAVVHAATATERALRVEHALTDRDSRLVAVESQLHAIATAEGLKAEVEACRRQAARLESRVDAAAAVCARAEQLADRAAQQVATFADRIDACERTTQRGAGAVQQMQDAVEACESAHQLACNRLDTGEAAAQRQGHLLTQLEQRVAGQENRLGLWRQQQEQHLKDQATLQREQVERAEVVHAVATRAQQVSSDARAEVHRLERRLDDVDRSLGTAATEATTLRGSVDGLRAQSLDLQRQQQLAAEEVRLLATRVEERTASLKEAERGVRERVDQAEAHTQRVAQKVAVCEERLQEMGGRVQDYLKDAMRHHIGEAQKRLYAAVNEGVTGVANRVAAVEAAAEQTQHRLDEVPRQLGAMQETSASLQRRVQALESASQSLTGQTQRLASHAEAQAGDHQRLGTVQQELMRLTAALQRTKQDVAVLQDALRSLHAAAAPTTTAGPARDRSASGLGVWQAHTASTDTAPAAEVNTPAPSAHHSVSSVARGASHTLTTAAAAAAAAEVPPRPRRASPDSSGSSERPALQLSGVSSVRPHTEEAGRLHSLVEARAPSTDSAEVDGTAELFVSPGGRAAEQRRGLAATPPRTAAGATETAEQLSAPARTSAAANVSHRTAIREFTTIASSSSSDDDDDAVHTTESGGGGPAAAAAGLERAALARRTRLEDDASLDLTTAVTLTSEAPPSQHSGGPHRRSSHGDEPHQPGRAQRASPSASSSDERAPVVRRATDAMEEEEGSDDRVEAMPRHTSDVDATDEHDAGDAQEPPTGDSAPSPRDANWGDWDEEDEEDEEEEEDQVEDEERRAAPGPLRSPPSAASDDSGMGDVVMRMHDTGDTSGTRDSRETTSTPPAAGLAATVVHQRHDDDAEELRATPRRAFAGTAASPAPHRAVQLPDAVPRHGRGTTSSSSSSAERAEALGLRSASRPLPAQQQQHQTQQTQPQVRRYTDFDDSTSSDEA
ncbi:hypothetical protein NESM_000713400 [Novymonas esmeraldas]|uniref:Uncharacterized protein n=1 Tax=Novymonas esmeraldas TaxID=1808958 RepID=A0AAW0EXM4_9TRYP